eukprot:scaffold52385_cov34-Tisochrysis_lutea.AAC.6
MEDDVDVHGNSTFTYCFVLFRLRCVLAQALAPPPPHKWWSVKESSTALLSLGCMYSQVASPLAE